MTTQTEAHQQAGFQIHPATRLGHVHYTVIDLDRQIQFYQTVLGFKLHWREDAAAGLGAGAEDLLRLTQLRSAYRTPGTTGIYHFALLYPSRRELARAVARLFQLRYPNYPTDHVVSKTTYLDDPEGNNIELYVRSLEDGTMIVEDGRFIVRRADGTPSDGREPLDVEALFRELAPDDKLDEPLPAGTQIGHVHLYAASLERSLHFYHGVLGFQTGLVAPGFRMADVSPTAEKPHVIAFNTWLGEGAPPSPPNSLGLRYFTIVLPDNAHLKQVSARLQEAGITVERTANGLLVRDPSQIAVLLTAEKGPQEMTGER